MTEATLEPPNVVVTPISDFRLGTSEAVNADENADEVVRFRVGEVADWSIMTDRMALVRRSRGVMVGFDMSLKVVEDSALGCGEPSLLKCDCESTDCRMGDSGGRGSGDVSYRDWIRQLSGYRRARSRL